MVAQFLYSPLKVLQSSQSSQSSQPHNSHFLSPSKHIAIANMSNGEHSRLQLNNLLQRSYGTNALQWQCYQTGPQHISPWIAIAYINGVEYGRGQGHTQGAAKEQAAAAAYNGLYAELSRRR